MLMATTVIEIDLIFCELNGTNQGKNNKIFVIMQNSTTNENSFNRFSSARGNGEFTIGSVFLIVKPFPIVKYMNLIPIIER